MKISKNILMLLLINSVLISCASKESQIKEALQKEYDGHVMADGITKYNECTDSVSLGFEDDSFYNLDTPNNKNAVYVRTGFLNNGKISPGFNGETAKLLKYLTTQNLFTEKTVFAYNKQANKKSGAVYQMYLPTDEGKKYYYIMNNGKLVFCFGNYRIKSIDSYSNANFGVEGVSVNYTLVLTDIASWAKNSPSYVMQSELKNLTKTKETFLAKTNKGYEVK